MPPGFSLFPGVAEGRLKDSSEDVQRGSQLADRSRTISNLTGYCTSHFHRFRASSLTTWKTPQKLWPQKAQR